MGKRRTGTGGMTEGNGGKARRRSGCEEETERKGTGRKMKRRDGGNGVGS